MTVALIGLHLVGGVGIGLCYFSTLWWAVRRLAAGRAGWTAALAIAGRFAILAAVLVGVGWEGPGPLLATALGFLAGRFVVLRHVRVAPARELAS